MDLAGSERADSTGAKGTRLKVRGRGGVLGKEREVGAQASRGVFAGQTISYKYGKNSCKPEDYRDSWLDNFNYYVTLISLFSGRSKYKQVSHNSGQSYFSIG